MHPPFAFVGAANHSRYGIRCAARHSAFVDASSVIAPIWCSWKCGIFPSGHSGTRSPFRHGAGAAKREKDRRQKTKDERQRTEDGRRKTEDRGFFILSPITFYLLKPFWVMKSQMRSSQV